MASARVWPEACGPHWQLAEAQRRRGSPALSIPALCPGIPSLSAYILVLARVLTPCWAPKEEPAVPFWNGCSLGVHMWQGAELALLGWW